MKKLLFSLLMLFSITSFAHVNVYPKSGPAGSYSLVTFNLPHACKTGKTKLTIIPLGEGWLIKPEQTGDWKVDFRVRKLKEPYTGKSGITVYDEVSEVTYTGKLQQYLSKQFNMLVKAPETPGEIHFQTIMQCSGKNETEENIVKFEVKEKQNK
jgi:uncharacterized protein YcnI